MISTALGWFGVAGALVMVLFIVVDVIARNLFGLSFLLTIDFTTYWLMPVVALCPLAAAQFRGEHISVSALTARLGARGRRAVRRSVLCLMLIVVVLLGWSAWDIAIDKMRAGESGLSATWLPIWPARFVVAAALTAWALSLFACIFEADADEASTHAATPGATS
ncbi:TRAP transporter small permease subunit [Microbacterium album]|uniref:TRAP transporter small permease subunit n=1 Tax=Microbacterium album TaxID=2053191 RepID=UPI00166E37F8|nr:TRAP transporter small permease subunit [Microbacterium album]